MICEKKNLSFLVTDIRNNPMYSYINYVNIKFRLCFTKQKYSICNKVPCTLIRFVLDSNMTPKHKLE
jgi:hypothetical protein